jgi:signal peptidase II
MSLKKAYFFIFSLLLLDQIIKIYVKTHFKLADEILVGGASWCRIHFIENEGMAWGTEIPGEYGKIFLTVFRLFAVTGIAYWLWDAVKKQSSNFLIVAISLIFAGAMGNIIDSVFYGVIFDDSYNNIATLFSENPYGTWFHGEVVDMFYFPMWHGNLPTWLPKWGGQDFTFFNAIFNFADFSICVGVGILIAFNKRAFAEV